MLLWPERVVACTVLLPSVYAGCIKLLLVESGFPDLFFIRISLGSARFFFRTCPTVFSDVFGRSDPFLVHQQPSSLNFLCHVQICIAVGNCFENFLTNACCTILFDRDRAYSNTQNAFSIPVKGISTSVKIKTSNIKHQILTCLRTCCQNEKKFERDFA